MIIDSHVHLKHGNIDRTEFTPEQIVQSMDDAGVDKSVVFAICTTTKRAIEMAAAAQAAYPDRLIPYAYAIPSVERAILPELEHAVTDLGFKGIKMHRGEYTLAEYVVDPVLDLAGRLQVPCLIDFAGNHRDLERMASTFPQTTLIPAHLGRYLSTDAESINRFIEVAEAHENVYLDISGVVLLWKIAEAVERAGADRVIWGSDGPLAAPDLGGYIRTDMRKVEAAGLGESELKAVLGGNIARLLGM